VTLKSLAFLLLAPGLLAAQAKPSDVPITPIVSITSADPSNPNQVIIPSGTQIPLSLKQAISTKNAKEDDPVYAETTFPFVLNDHIIVPAGTYVQGRISHVQRAGRVKGRAEILIHFTTLIYPSGYTVMLPGSIQNMPGADKTSMKDQEGTVREDSQTASKLGTAAKDAGVGGTAGVAGGLAGGVKGAEIGGASGAAVGALIGLFSRGSDVKLEPGTTIQMIIQRDVPLDKTRITVAGNHAN
jgi:type IV secretion system protein VirB10